MSAKLSVERLEARDTPAAVPPFPDSVLPFHLPVLGDVVEAAANGAAVEYTYADLTRDGHHELVVTFVGGPRVMVFDGKPARTPAEDLVPPPLLFDAFLPGFQSDPSAGSVWADGFVVTPVDRVWSIDAADNPGSDLLFTPAGTSGGPVGTLLRWNGGGFDAASKLLLDDPNFRGAVYVDSADVTGDGNSEVVAWAGPGGAPRLVVYSLDPGTLEFSTLYSVYIGPEDDRSGAWRPVPAGYTRVDNVPAVVSSNGDRFDSRVTLLTTGETVTVDNGPPGEAV